MFKGRPILGVITGFMFGLFLGPTLWLWGLIHFHHPLMWILPLVGIVLGLVMAAWAPFGKGAPAPAAAAPAAEAAAPEPISAEPAAAEPPAAAATDEADEAGSDE